MAIIEIPNEWALHAAPAAPVFVIGFPKSGMKDNQIRTRE
jgi:hypothetical protein